MIDFFVHFCVFELNSPIAALNLLSTILIVFLYQGIVDGCAYRFQ